MKKSVVFLLCLVDLAAYAESYNIETYCACQGPIVPRDI